MLSRNRSQIAAARPSSSVSVREGGISAVTLPSGRAPSAASTRGERSAVASGQQNRLHGTDPGRRARPRAGSRRVRRSRADAARRLVARAAARSTRRGQGFRRIHRRDVQDPRTTTATQRCGDRRPLRSGRTRPRGVRSAARSAIGAGTGSSGCRPAAPCAITSTSAANSAQRGTRGGVRRDQALLDLRRRTSSASEVSSRWRCMAKRVCCP